MRKNLIGLGFALFTVSMSFLIFSVLINNKSVGIGIFIGMAAMAFYALPFVIIGALVSHYFVSKLIKFNGFQYFIHAVLGGILAVSAVYVFHFNTEPRMVTFIVITGVLGSLMYYFGIKASEKLF